MKTQLYRTVLIPLLALTTGCSMTHGTSSNPAKNPHPVKRYEVIATSDAPGSWDSIEGYIGYDIINTECMPLAPFFGERSLTSIGISIQMDRVDSHTWKGEFYRDVLKDEDYAKLGVCHWDVTSVGVSATAKGVRFNWADTLVSLLHGGTAINYFKKSAYGDKSLKGYPALTLNDTDTEVFQNPASYFRVTIAIKEIAP